MAIKLRSPSVCWAIVCMEIMPVFHSSIFDRSIAKMTTGDYDEGLPTPGGVVTCGGDGQPPNLVAKFQINPTINK